MLFSGQCGRCFVFAKFACWETFVILSPYRFEPDLSPEEYQKIGQLSLRWSHIEHVIGNCLKTMLRLTDEEAIVVVFPLSLDQRLQRMNRLAEINQYTDKAIAALDELTEIMKGIQYVRNNVIHAILLEDENEGHVFHLRSKDRSLTKVEIFSSEELTNYAAHLTLTLRYALGLKGLIIREYASPDRPEIPAFLRELIQTRK